mgnify:CR=1 FL=1
MPPFELVLFGDRVDVHRTKPGDLATQIRDIRLDGLPINVKRISRFVFCFCFLSGGFIAVKCPQVGLVFIVTTRDEAGAPLGFLGSFVQQVALSPPTVCVAIGADREPAAAASGGQRGGGAERAASGGSLA